MRINQFHSGTAVGDAITNQMLLIKELLQKEGYESHVYAEHIPDELSKEIELVDSYHGVESDILFVHHSMGFDGFNKVVNLPAQKILIYHNITPERFFIDEYTKEYIRKGRRQISEYKNFVQFAIADSNYNRKELIEQGYRDVDVMPVQISLDRFEGIESDKEIIEQYRNKTVLLFVGRIVSNKCQHDIVKTFDIYHKYFNKESVLLLVGDFSYGPYVKEVKELIISLGLEENVILTGKVSEKELKTYYELANVFLCMSEHEGFGVPLLEAMKAGIPVVSYKSSAIAETMGGAGVLFEQKDYSVVAGLVHEIVSDNDMREKIVMHQKQRIYRLENTNTRECLINAITRCKNGGRKTTIQMQGPFETSYSLAIVNRKLIEAMDATDKVDASIYCTEGPGDYLPKEEDLADKPRATALWKKASEVVYPDVTIRNMYPPRVKDVNGGLNFQSFGWEESILPEKYVKDFNQYLDGIGTMSEFVVDVLRESGVTVPMKVMGIGVELVNGYDKLKPYKLNTKKKTKFLHISSAFPRKGVDILLDAYFKTFTGNDEVCLVIKTFPNPHNTVEKQLEELRMKYDNAPEVELINRDLPEEELFSLYKAADVYVHVARGEGFGLPVAEAMLAGIPVMVSPNSGLADFCAEETAVLIDYDMEYADTHLTTGKSMWAKPREAELCKKMWQFVYEREKLGIQDKIQNAQKLIREKFTWEKVAERWMNFILETERNCDKSKVAMVTTWNSKCGIAEFTRMQIESMRNSTEFEVYPNYGVDLLRQDEEYVKERTWHSAFLGTADRLIDELGKSTCRTIHIQFNFGFFKLEELEKLINKLCERKNIVITFHKTKDANVGGKVVSLKSIVNALNKCHKVVVHQNEDKDYLISIGISEKLIVKIPLGQVKYFDKGNVFLKKELGIPRSLVLGSYGFLLPHKGIYENIQAVRRIKKKIPDVLYLVVCAQHECQESKNYLDQCRQYVEENGLLENVVFITEYLDNDEAITLLQICDALLMTYLPSEESASGAVRFCIAANRPTITTKQKIFDEFKDITLQVEATKPEEIEKAVYKILDNEIIRHYKAKMKNFIRNSSWEVVAEQYNRIYRDDN